MLQEYEEERTPVIPLKPSPGSREAAEKGCTCDKSRNNSGYGLSSSKGMYQVTVGCPLHWSMKGYF